MTANPFEGRLVRLAIFDPEKDSEHITRWNQDSEYQRLLDSGPSMLWPSRQVKEWLEKHFDELYMFSIRDRSDDRVIGMVDLSGFNWVTRNCWVGIGIGERELWGKGYGSDAMNLVLRYGFEALNLHRVSLTVFGYNQRAFKSYLKVGFLEEGRLRQWMQRSGERHDLIYMGILREEWEQKQAQMREVSVSIEETS